LIDGIASSVFQGSVGWGAVEALVGYGRMLVAALTLKRRLGECGAVSGLM